MVIEFIRSVEHNGPRKRFERLSVSDGVARQLIDRGIARAPKVDPLKTAGGKPSASPPVRALPQTTVKKSGRGGKKRQTADSSS